MFISLRSRFIAVFTIGLLIIIVYKLVEYKQGHDAERNAEQNIDSSDNSLIFVHSICRHGARNIVGAYPNDPYKNREKYWIEGFGQLTNTGKKTQYELGEYFRRRYKKLLGNGQYLSDKIYVHSTDSDRVLMSAAACMAGLFPPSGDQIWNENLSWNPIGLNPIPIHTIPENQDYTLGVRKSCDRFEYEMNHYINSTAYTGLFIKHRKLIEYLEKHSGKKLKSMLDIGLLYDTLSVERAQGYRLPLWAENVMSSKVSDDDFHQLAKHLYSIFTQTDEMKKLRSGFLLKEILNRFSSKLESTLNPDRSLWLYFAHDITIGDMLSSLGVKMHEMPPLSSCLLFELHHGDQDPFVQIFYKNSTKMDISSLEIPECGSKCALKKFYELYKNILPKRSHTEECALFDDEYMPPGGNSDLKYSLQ